MNFRSLFSLALVALLVASCSSLSWAQPTIDGTADPNAEGYVSLSVQNTNTGFGNATTGDLIEINGNEISQILGTIANGRLYMTIAGNLSDDFTKLMVFVDSDPSKGVNQILTFPDVQDDPNSNVPYGMDSFCCDGFPPPAGGNTFNEGALQRLDGMTFDPNFTADYALAFSNGQENVNPGDYRFWAMNAHYADLTQGVNGDVVAAGVVLAPEGLPNVLRGPLQGDFNNDGDVSGADFLIWQRNAGQFDPNDPNSSFALKGDGDANGDGFVNSADLAIWESQYGTNPGFSDFPFVPNSGILSTEVLIGPALPNLAQGELIDKNYAFDPNGGGCTDDAGTGCIVRELEFVLPVEDPNVGNPNNHRDFENTVDLELAINNSNTAGVDGGSDPNTGSWAATGGNPADVFTGVEFSIPLSEIGSPTVGDDLKILVMINGQVYDFMSNQFGGTGILQDNLGSPGSINLGSIAGDQFVTLGVPPLAAVVETIPEPSTLGLMLIGVGVYFRRRNR